MMMTFLWKRSDAKPQNIAAGMLTPLNRVMAKPTSNTVPCRLRIKRTTRVPTGPVAMLNGTTDLTHAAFFDRLELSGAVDAELILDSSEFALAGKGSPSFRASGKPSATFLLFSDLRFQSIVDLRFNIYY